MNKRQPLKLLMALILSGCSVVGIRSGTEEPGYQTITRIGPVEIRQYKPLLAASVTVPGHEIAARSAGFRRLARFIFGANTTNTSINMTAPVAQSSATIAMTAPVAQAQAPGGWVISFYMPSTYTAETLPKPLDPGIYIHEIPGRTQAVIRFSGIPTANAVATARATLMRTLTGSAWVVNGQPTDWFYDPPWTLPFLRRNEVAVPVTPKAPE
ncbi:MAG: heme-binding protein [Acidocella sp.]|nr:heme-binding protein [Acidocella sp.]